MMNYASWLVLVCFSVVAFPKAGTTYSFDEKDARPFYNIAHMVNNRNHLDQWLNYGANAIENDVSFEQDGTPRYFYHGFPCDAFRICSDWDYIKPYIEAVRARVEPDSPKFNPKFTLLMFDLKVRKLVKQDLKRAGRKFVDMVLTPLFHNTSGRLKAVLSVLDDRKTDIIEGVLDRLNETNPEIVFRIGFDVENLDVLDQETLERIPEGHIWLSEGVSNWFVPFYHWVIKDKLAKLVKQKDRVENKESKVYTWTVDDKWTMKFYLETGLDAIITNRPQNVNKAIAEFNKRSKEIIFRLATMDDDPFAK